MRIYLAFFLFILSINSSFALEKKRVLASRIFESPKIDGILVEKIWETVNPAAGFIQNQTKPGTPASQATEVKILYDDDALYIGAVLYDVSPDSILRELGKRDTEGNTDLFGFVLDTYKDGINAFGFFVTPAGVQLDARYSANGQDLSWNAVWQSKVSIVGNNWIAEIKIPYSAIRFSNKEEQVWGVNFVRKIRRHREICYWNNIDPSVDGFVNQFGELRGIQSVQSPVRLSLTPYISGYSDNYKDFSGATNLNSTNYNFNAGADLKYGINESFTLDMTLIPDFGQVQSDNQVLNLSPYEVQFNEFRPFFTEGTELFNRGDLFYSRRVGGTPAKYYEISSELGDNEYIINSPSVSQLLNATKISGRTEKKLGIGLFNATVNRTYATIQNSNNESRLVITDPLTNYSVIVLDQAMKNNSYISFVNTNVLREGSFYDANVSGMQFKFQDKKTMYALRGNSAISRKYSENDQSDSPGYAYDFDLSKISGKFQFSLLYNVKSDLYDPRDLGYLQVNNQINYTSRIKYNIYKPFWKVNSWYNTISLNKSLLYLSREHQQYTVTGSSFTTFTKQFLSTGLTVIASPFEGKDFFEPRMPGRFLVVPANSNISYWLSTDYRKKFAIDVSLFLHKFSQAGRQTINMKVSPRYRVNNKLSFILEFEEDSKKNNVGFVNNKEDNIYIGERNINTFTSTIRSNYTFTNLMALSLRIRHYWSIAEYSNYYLLNNKGNLENSNYDQIHDVNFNAFNIDMVYTWNLAPGSEMSIVWKNSILKSGNQLLYDYADNFRSTIESPQLNSLSVKVLYYIDYLRLKSIIK